MHQPSAEDQHHALLALDGIDGVAVFDDLALFINLFELVMQDALYCSLRIFFT